jgi:hypothetical protein
MVATNLHAESDRVKGRGATTLAGWTSRTSMEPAHRGDSADPTREGDPMRTADFGRIMQQVGGMLSGNRGRRSYPANTRTRGVRRRDTTYSRGAGGLGGLVRRFLR